MMVSLFSCIGDNRKKGSMAKSSFKLEHPLGLCLFSLVFPLIFVLFRVLVSFIHLNAVILSVKFVKVAILVCLGFCVVRYVDRYG